MKKCTYTKLVWILWLFMLSASISACGIAELVNDIEEQVADVVSELEDSVLAGLEDEAKAKGGTAAKWAADEEFSLEVSDSSSSIAGATLLVPANALPNGVTQAIAIIEPAAAGALTDTGIDYFAMGPAVEIRVLSYPEMVPVTLVEDSSVYVPYKTAKNPNVDPADIHNAHFLPSGMALLEPAAANKKQANLVGGLTRNFSPFMAITMVQPNGIFSYEGRDGLKELCKASLDLTQDTVTGEIWNMINSNDKTKSTVEILVGSGNKTDVKPSIYFFLADVPNPGTPPTSDILQFDKDSSDIMDLNLHCSDTDRVFSYDMVNVDILGIDVRRFVESSRTDASCGFGQSAFACIKLNGTAWVKITASFTDTNTSTPSAMVEFDGIMDVKDWQIVP